MSFNDINLLRPPFNIAPFAGIKVVKAMIHDLTDLEPLLHQYDQEKVLVGPLFNLWTNSSFRAFNIAGKSGRIYETVGLGFFELETIAQRRRADIVTSLEGCFGEVKIFDSQLKMAQAAHTLWANEETARVLATAEWESKPRPTRETRQKQKLTGPDEIKTLSGDRDNESSDEGAWISAALPDGKDPGPAHAPPSAPDQPTPAGDPAQASEPLYLRDDTDAFADPGTPAETAANLEPVRNLSAIVAGSSVPNKHGLRALGGVVACWAASFGVGFLIGTAVFTHFTKTDLNRTFTNNVQAVGIKESPTIAAPLPPKNSPLADKN
jgi:hypothetical protein